MSLLLQMHTIELSARVNQYEANNICHQYGVKATKEVLINHTGIRGLNKIKITCSNFTSRSGQEKKTCWIKLVVNTGKVLGKDRLAMSEIRTSDIEKLKKKLGRICKKLGLSLNKQDADAWSLTRADVGYDFHTGVDSDEYLKVLMKLLHHSYNPLNSRHYSITQFKGFDDPAVQQESMRVNNTMATYNIYVKKFQIAKDVRWNLSPDEELWASDMVRVEKQLIRKGLDFFSKGKKSISILSDEDAAINAMEKIIKEVEDIFGTGDHVGYDEGLRLIYESQFDADSKRDMFRLYKRVHFRGFPSERELIEIFKDEDFVKKKIIKGIKRAKKNIESLGIACAALGDDEIRILGADRIPSLGKIMRQKYAQTDSRRSRRRFGRIYFDRKNDRWKCNFTVYDAAQKPLRLSVAGHDTAEVEEKIYNKIMTQYAQNIYIDRGDLVRCRTDLKCVLENFLSVASDNMVKIRIVRELSWLDLFFQRFAN